MPNTRSTRVPAYRHHKPSGQAVVTINGRDHYLGRWNSEESKQAYDRLVGEWQANGRQLPEATEPQAGLTVSELILAYWRFAELYYRKNGRPMSELVSIRESVRPLKRLYGKSLARDFGPLALKACREVMINADLSRGVINSRIGRIKRIFKWAVENELVPSSLYHGLQAVAGLKHGRSGARETEPVRPIPEEHIEAVLPVLSAEIQAMVRLQLLTGMRPGEVRLMRGCDLDTTGRLWAYQPESHKTEHHGIERVIYLGPQAQRVLAPFLKPELSGYLFDPREAENARHQRQRQSRKSRMTPSQGARRPKEKPKRLPGDHYTKDSYARAIRRACDEANVPRWHPHQLRHNAATRLRKEYGLEVAQVVLGHRTAQVTQIYAERDQDRAREIMARIG